MDKAVTNGTADLILLHGNVITMTVPNKREQAVAIVGDRILEIGPDWAMEQLRGPATEVVDLAGRTVLPGFVDSHVHCFLTSVSLRSAQLGGATSVAEACRRMREQAAHVPAGEWVYGFGYPTANYRPPADDGGARFRHR